MTLEPKSQPNNGKRPEITLAKWSSRLVALLIDVAIISTVSESLTVALPLSLGQQPLENTPIGPAKFAIWTTMLFAYWAYFEAKSGQSIGKKLLKIKTTDLAGNKVSVKSAVIDSFGKACLFPLDALLGLIFAREKRQRIFSRAADTIVVKEGIE